MFLIIFKIELNIFVFELLIFFNIYFHSVIFFNDLFFQLQFYYLASIRMQDLCGQLSISDEDLMRKIWTCFEHVIIEHTNMMRDRHLDQILMCTIYIICRV